MLNPSTFEDVLTYVMHESPLQEASRRDYASAIKRLPLVTGTNRLADIPADFAVIKARLYVRKYDRHLFKSVQAYHAWRRKVLAALKLFLGLIAADRASRHQVDGWAHLKAEAALLIAKGELILHINGLLPLAFITKLARMDSLEPRQMDNAYILARSHDLHASQIPAFRRSVRLLARLQKEAPKLRDLLPMEDIAEIKVVRRDPLPPIPQALLGEVDVWLETHHQGELDPVSNTMVDGRSEATIYGYRQAFRSYLGNAAKAGVLTNITSLEQAVMDDVAVPAMRAMINGTQPQKKQQLAPKTMLDYLEDVARLANLEGIETPAITKALKWNPKLKKGKVARRRMSPENMAFCSWLLSSRDNEMRFRSLHIRLHKRTLALMDQRDAGRRMKHLDQRVVQAGSLAAMTAIWLWGAPLRIGNTVALRLYGTAPQVFLPSGKQKELDIKIAAEETKNKRQLDQRINPGRHRAIEVVRWYIDEVRPLIPSADESIYLFPSSLKGRDHITGSAVRKWLHLHAVDEGIQINPHQFRHGAASLYIRGFPGAYDHVAKLLDDKPETVRRYYAWIDEEAVMADVQSNIIKLAGFQ